MSARCWVITSSVLDNVYKVPRLPQPGESVLVSSIEKFFGGKGTNQAIACARSGAVTFALGCVGEDEAGDEFIALMKQEGINISGMRQSKISPTGQAAISVQPNGLNQISVYVGANMDLSVSQIEDADINPDDYILCQLEVPLAVVHAASQKAKFILNPAPHSEISDELISKCFAITPNETEAKALTGILPVDENSMSDTSDFLLTRGAQNVLLTLGDRGVYWKSNSESGFFPAPLVRAVDTTGAGDVFNGCLLARLAHGGDFPSAIEYSVAAASLSVTRPGAVPSIPTDGETRRFLAEGQD